METIGKQELWSILDGERQSRVLSCTKIRHGRGCKVESFLNLATRVAELQFKNRDYVLLFRGQSKDYTNRQKNTSLKPSLFRPTGRENPSSMVLMERFATLREAEPVLVEMYLQEGFPGIDRLKRQQILRWSILQHYEVCPTPLLDVTQSLRIAASFASHGADEEAFVFVLGVPNLSGAITASAEAGVQIVRLSSVCPPSALRPHIQEGYLLGEYPEMTGYDQKRLYAHHEIDFGLRLVAKFRFNPKVFWKNDAFQRVKRVALYPSAADDPLFKLTQSVKKHLSG